MDFGASARDGQRHSSECVGTAYYAPERARVMFGGGEPPAVSASHDVWAFGVLAYEQCAGVPLFSHDLVDDDIRDDDERNRLCMWRWPSDETLSKVFAGNDTDATEAQRAAACNLIARCLDGDPAKRPDSREILDHPFLREDGELEPLDCRYHFFLSHYQAQASGAVAGLYFHLRLRGALVWLDQYQEDITESGMRAGVEASDVFIFFLTSRALTRPFCLKEFGWALDAGKPIVLVREDDERFSPWRYDKARGQSWDPQVRGWIPDDQYATCDGPNRQLRDEVDRQARPGTSSRIDAATLKSRPCFASCSGSPRRTQACCGGRQRATRRCGSAARARCACCSCTTNRRVECSSTVCRTRLARAYDKFPRRRMPTWCSPCFPEGRSQPAPAAGPR